MIDPNAIDYLELQADAKALIDANGRELSLQPAPLANTTEPWKVDPAPAAATFIGIVTRFGKKFVDGTTIRATDTLIIAAHDMPTVPLPGDKITDDTQVLTVVDTVKSKPGDVVLAHRIQARA